MQSLPGVCAFNPNAHRHTHPVSISVSSAPGLKSIRFGRFLRWAASIGGTLTYLSTRRFASALEGHTRLIVVTTADLCDYVPAGNSVLLTRDHPRNTFYALMDAARDLGFFECLETYIAPSAKISAAARIPVSNPSFCC
jgi:hypothetical protein